MNLKCFFNRHANLNYTYRRKAAVHFKEVTSPNCAPLNWFIMPSSTNLTIMKSETEFLKMKIAVCNACNVFSFTILNLLRRDVSLVVGGLGCPVTKCPIYVDVSHILATTRECLNYFLSLVRSKCSRFCAIWSSDQLGL